MKVLQKNENWSARTDDNWGETNNPEQSGLFDSRKNHDQWNNEIVLNLNAQWPGMQEYRGIEHLIALFFFDFLNFNENFQQTSLQ